ncbi:hypothetical protein AVEN_229032-1 [Araneus ventricosus]|uniref:Uncharacterized protein n=1 Tax=Araneus ventricosus TaxID=182803 RepID=A0A4Y2CX86_ARAVE|nr:hypothetical protein AVEN_229032-1 [Araneus ventricosus]
MKRKRRKHETTGRNWPKISAFEAPVGLHVSLEPLQLPMSAKRSGNSRQPIGFLQASVRVQAPIVLYTPLMECCRPVSNRWTRIGVRVRGLTIHQDTPEHGKFS